MKSLLKFQIVRTLKTQKSQEAPTSVENEIFENLFVNRTKLFRKGRQGENAKIPFIGALIASLSLLLCLPELLTASSTQHDTTQKSSGF